VFKFKLELVDDPDAQLRDVPQDLEHNRVIPPEVKVAVWKRDAGRCVTYGSEDNLHFDHVLPYSKGGSSLVAENVQLLCARHNRSKSDRIE
jgi:5-methylcytosine-specific restriction endonuclease McrA